MTVLTRRLRYSADGISFGRAQTLQSADVPYLMAHDGLADIVPFSFTITLFWFVFRGNSRNDWYLPYILDAFLQITGREMD